ncbi:MAG: hypothetical protein JSS49_10625 [Planctomycetes bacterium]|nr:hypothetical protein [Planctomycetota bacterium]
MSPWIGGTLPETTEPQLRQVFALWHHSWSGLEPSAEERIIDKVECGCSWRDSTRYWGHQLLMQWKWDHSDRATLLAEEAEQAKQRLPWLD